MKIYLKETIYFEIDVADGTDRKTVTESFSQVITPQLEEIYRKIKFDKKDSEAFLRLTGKHVKLSLLSAQQFVKKSGSRK